MSEHIIARMNWNSLFMKFTTLAMVVLSLLLKEHEVGSVAIVFCTYLDSYYLSLERSIRTEDGYKRPTICRHLSCLVSPSVWVYYTMMLLILFTDMLGRV